MLSAPNLCLFKLRQFMKCQSVRVQDCQYIYYKFGMMARFGNYLVPLLILLQLLIEVMSQNNTEVNATLNAQKKATVFKYFIFSEKCYDTLVIDRNFAHFECIKFTVSKILSYAIVVGAAIVKVPQIIKIISNKSTRGVSFQSVVLEEINSIAAFAYNIYRGNPFSIYGQTLLIAYQMLLIQALFVVFDKERRTKAILLLPPLIAFFVAGYYPEYGVFPTYIFENMIVFQIIMFSGARLMQIFEIHKLKSTGSVSLITYGLSTLGVAARTATALVEVKDDWKLILSYVIAFSLNSYICLCFFLFRNTKAKKQ